MKWSPPMLSGIAQRVAPQPPLLAAISLLTTLPSSVTVIPLSLPPKPQPLMVILSPTYPDSGLIPTAEDTKKLTSGTPSALGKAPKGSSVGTPLIELGTRKETFNA